MPSLLQKFQFQTKKIVGSFHKTYSVSHWLKTVTMNYAIATTISAEYRTVAFWTQATAQYHVHICNFLSPVEKLRKNPDQLKPMPEIPVAAGGAKIFLPDFHNA